LPFSITELTSVENVRVKSAFYWFCSGKSTVKM